MSKIINGFPHIPYTGENYPADEMIAKSKDYFHWLNQRRTVRDISNKPVPKEVIENLVQSASTAPSGAHKQPWTFCLIANPEMKKQIRIAAEEEEYQSYNSRMSDQWLKDLKAIGTDWHKPFLEEAPWLIIVFKKVYELQGKEKRNNYYVNESVGLACGFLLTAIHNAGLVALTHTPSPMNFLSKILKRPENERPFLLVPVGYPKDNAHVPDLSRKDLTEVALFFD